MQTSTILEIASDHKRSKRKRPEMDRAKKTPSLVSSELTAARRKSFKLCLYVCDREREREREREGEREMTMIHSRDQSTKREVESRVNQKIHPKALHFRLSDLPFGTVRNERGCKNMIWIRGCRTGFPRS
jgi:hypothetical protein